MNFCCTSGDVVSINDKQIHHVNAQETMSCFTNALSKVKTDKIIYSELSHDDNYIILKPRDDGNYTMVDELFEQFIPNEKWASVAITGKDGKPFYIKDEWLKFQIIMRCEQSVVGISGNNDLLNKLILEESEYPNYRNDDYKEKAEKWYKWWGAKPHFLDLEIFKVGLFSNSYIRGTESFVHPKTGKVGFITNCRWTYEPIENCREELEWVCNEICDEENNLEFYVSFFNEDINLGKYKKEYKDPQVTFKLSHKGIELVPTIPIKKMKWVFKCNHVMGKEWKKSHFLWKFEKPLRRIQEKLFNEKYVIWNNYTLMGDCLNNLMNLGERYYTVDEIIRMIQMYKELYCE